LNAAIERRRLGALTLENVPQPDPELEERWAQYAEIRSSALADWAPGGRGLLIQTRFAQTVQLHHVAAPGAMRRQLTFFSEPIGAVATGPDAARPAFLFLKDRGGDEFSQLYRFDWNTGGIARLSDGASLNASPVWSRRGDRFIYTSTRRNGRDRDLWLAREDDPARPRMVLSAGGNWRAIEWSPDDRRILVAHYVSIAESHFHVLDVETGRRTEVRPGGAAAHFEDAVWAPDGGGLYYGSDEGAEFVTLRYLDLATGVSEPLSAAIPGDVGQILLSPDRKTLVFQVNADGYTELHALDLAGRRMRPLKVGVPRGKIFGLRFHPTANRLAFHWTAPDTPGDAGVLDLEGGGFERWTFSETAGLDPRRFVTPSLIRYPTFDAVDGRPREIPAFYYRPPGAGPFPVLIHIHGGPESQFVPRFEPVIAFLTVEEGIAVLAPNVRGSSGYGRTYVGLDDGRRREDSVRDIGALLEWIAAQPELDARRVAVMGSSYGGYMVLASLVHFGERLACGVEAVGIGNFVTFLENTQEYRRDQRRAEYGDERDPQMRRFLLSISPHTHAERIRKPLLIAQGRNDPRVPASESEQMVAAIRNAGGTVACMIADNEGHGFRKKDNQRAFYTAATLFLRRYLKGR